MYLHRLKKQLHTAMKVKDITALIEAYAPPAYQESYDNCGIQVGNHNDDVTGVLIALDVTEAILEEAISRGCNMVLTHHPLIFGGIKRLTGANYVERIVKMAIKNDICIYAAHTNMDNVKNGVNAKIAEKLGLTNVRILAPKENLLYKLYTYAPMADASRVRDALFAAGAGHISQYSECSFNSNGIGTFRGAAGTNPTIGLAGGPREEVQETKIEVIVSLHQRQAVLQALKDNHPYEEVAYELIALSNAATDIGAGMLGELPEAMSETDALQLIKDKMRAECIRHTSLLGKPVRKIAVCGGSGSFLLRNAISAGADMFVTADYKYHQFFDAEQKIVIADIGHYESEQYTSEIFHAILTKKYPNFAILLSNLSTNPVKYFC